MLPTLGQNFCSSSGLAPELGIMTGGDFFWLLQQQQDAKEVVSGRAEAQQGSAAKLPCCRAEEPSPPAESVSEATERTEGECGGHRVMADAFLLPPPSLPLAPPSRRTLAHLPTPYTPTTLACCSTRPAASPCKWRS
jgi:hypothetical protein